MAMSNQDLWESAKAKTQKGSWLPSNVRAFFLSVRPWSLPSSAFPCLLIFLDLRKNHEVEFTLVFVFGLLTVCGLHALANIVNTVKDYENKVDGKSAADRTLVDKTVDLHSFKVLGAVFFVFGLLCTFILRSSVTFLAMLLSIIYTAGPALKYLALGDLVIFVLFGPSISYFITSLYKQEDLQTPLLLSCIIGFQTVAILHANNARDLKHDREKNVWTVANLIGLPLSKYYYILLHFLSYSISFYCYGVEAWFLLICIPNTRYIISRFYNEDFSFLDERTAQHNLLFQALLAATILEFRLLAKISIAAIYVLGGINNIITFEYTKFLVKESFDRALGLKIPEWVSSVSLLVTVTLQLISSFMFVFSWDERKGAMGMIIFLIPVTACIHDFWNFETDVRLPENGKNSLAPRTCPAFLTSFDNHFVHFFKNVSIIGGLALFLSD